MIPRTLVPSVVLPADPAAESDARPRRGSTLLDSRQLVPMDLPRVELDTRSNIPSHVPLEVLGSRQLIPRDMPAKPLETRSNIPTHLPLSVLDSRVVVPKGARAPDVMPHKPLPLVSSEVLPKDIFTTGEVQLLVREVEADTTGWHLQENWPARIGSIMAHGALILLVLVQPRLFPFQPHTSEQNEIASRSLGMVYTPVAPMPVTPVPVVPAPQAAPQIRIDPRLFQRDNPTMEVPKELSATPAPRPEPAKPEPGGGRADPEQPRFENPPPRAEPRLQPKFEPTVRPEASSAPFALPGSPGKSLEESLRAAGKTRTGGGPTTGTFGGDIPGGPLGSGSSGGKAYGAIELLTPTEGVDFSHYLARVLASVRRNWYAVIPESARLGERGKVVLQFRIMRNGSVGAGEPNLVRTSGRQPLDSAAVSSIRTSNPFEPLPGQFTGPFIELRFTYLYNLPLDTP